MNFWQNLKKPIFCLAPMADVTDCAFRSVIAKYGKPDVMWTEFVSVDGLVHPEARERLAIDLRYGEYERPIVAQIFGSKPEYFEEVARMLAGLGFDGIDINMGCPVQKVINQKSCSALIRTPELAQEIVRAAKRGAGDLPVSVKTRIGFSRIEIESWIPAILETKPAVLTVHMRTAKEMSKVPAHWELMKDIVALRDKLSPETLIIGNGDALHLADAKNKVSETGCDGVMLGRAIFGNPWLFSGHIPTVEEKLRVMIEHTKLFEQMLGTHKNFAIMKKHYKAYVNGFDGAKELRVKLMEAPDAAEVERLTLDFLNSI